MSRTDQEYWERRALECLAHAERAADPSIAEVHRQFAAEYERKLAAMASLPVRNKVGPAEILMKS